MAISRVSQVDYKKVTEIFKKASRYFSFIRQISENARNAAWNEVKRRSFAQRYAITELHVCEIRVRVSRP